MGITEIVQYSVGRAADLAAGSNSLDEPGDGRYDRRGVRPGAGGKRDHGKSTTVTEGTDFKSIRDVTDFVDRFIYGHWYAVALPSLS